jgi:hypothetical protein
LEADRFVLVLEENIDPRFGRRSAVQFEDFGGSDPEGPQIVRDPFSKLAWGYSTFNLGEGEQGATSDPRGRIFVMEEGTDGIGTLFDAMLAQVVQCFRALNPTLRFQLLQHASGTRRGGGGQRSTRQETGEKPMRRAEQEKS